MKWFKTTLRLTGKLYHYWMAFTHRLGNLQARILLSGVFLALVLPIGLVRRLREDPLRMNQKFPVWLTAEPDDSSLTASKRQY